jgi:hypothetical protein
MRKHSDYAAPSCAAQMGSKGGKRRAATLSTERMREIGRVGAATKGFLAMIRSFDAELARKTAAALKAGSITEFCGTISATEKARLVRVALREADLVQEVRRG